MLKSIKSLSLFLLIVFTIQAKIAFELEQRLAVAADDDMVGCLVIMASDYPFQQMRSSSVLDKIVTYRSIAKESQEALLSDLSKKSGDIAKIKQYWVFNGIFLKAKPAVIREIAQRNDVRWIDNNGIVTVDPIIAADKTAISQGVEWGVSKIEADKCWDKGITGEDVLIGIVDTGVDLKHPSLKDKWSGYWIVADGLPQQDEPYDDHGHGTHCVGSILGGDGRGSFEYDIGVAPGAKYAAGKGLNSGGSGSTTQLIQCLEYMADLKEKADLKAISNSWANSKGGDKSYLETFKTLRSLDIVPIVANGNNGSQGSGSVQSPGDYPNVVGVGATSKDDKIASFSSLGPTTQKDPWNDKSLWFRDDWNYIKPNVSAPGNQINSAKSGGGYTTMNGTSMATPHVCGVVALLFQKNRNLKTEMVYDLLVENADEVGGDTYPNNTFGWGRVNALKSVEATPTMNQPWINIAEKTLGDLVAGKTAELKITAKNIGGADAKNTKVTLISECNYLSFANATFQVGDLKPDETKDNNSTPFKITAHKLTPQGLRTKIGLVLDAKGQSSNLDFHDTTEITLTIGTALPPVAVYLEDFEYASNDSFDILWQTSGNWDYSSTQSNSSSHSAYSGAVEDGKVSLTLKKGIDLSMLRNGSVTFYEKHDIDKSFFAKAAVEASGDGGSTWNKIYSISGDNAPWTQQSCNITPYLSNNFKIRFVIDANAFFVKKADVYIDDIEIMAANDNIPPAFINPTIIKNPSNTGPFPVQSKVIDDNGVKEVKLCYRVNNGSWKDELMSTSGNDLYKAEIPKQNSINTKIDYYYKATDKWTLGTANEGSFPIGANDNGNFITFDLGGTPIQASQLLKNFTFGTQTANGAVNIQFSLIQDMKVTLKVFNIMGKELAVITNNVFKHGHHSLQWNTRRTKTCQVGAGVYFLIIEATTTNKNKQIDTYQLKERLLILK